MSTEQPLDPHLIEQTKQQIRSLVAEISQLAKEDISPEEFYGGFLTRVVSALAAVGGAVWTTNDEGRLALQYQINLQETRLRESEEAQIQHSRLLYKVLSEGEGTILQPHSGTASGVEGEIGNPTDFLLLFGLLKTDLEVGGIVEVFQRPDSGPSTQKGYLRFLLQMCELAGDYLKSHQLRHFSDRQSLWTQLEDFTRVVHATLDPRGTAYTIANEGRRLIECDRLSVAIRKGSKCTIEAVSGQDVFDKRSNLVRLLNKLTSAVVATGEPIWYTGDTRDMAPQVEEAVQEYVDESHSKTVAVLPLKRPEPPEEDDPKKRPEPQPCIGALIVEQIEDSRIPPSMLSRVDVVCRHSSAALANSLEHQNLFLMPLWRTIGKSRWIVQARTLPKTISIGGAILAVLLILCLWPAKFELETKGTLEPVERRNVFAGINGVVQDLKVEHGDLVKEGDLLVKLRSTEEDIALTDIEGKIHNNTELLRAISRTLNENKKISPEETNRLNSQKAELSATISGLISQRDKLRAKQAQLSVLSPISGIVVTWELHQRLLGRPVQCGQTLMRIADPDQEWQLELHMPEQRMGFIADAQNKIYQKEREQLRAFLIEQKQAANSSQNSGTDASTDTQAVEAEVDKELAKIANDDLYDYWNRLAKAKIDARLQEILKGMPEGDARTQLAEVIRPKSYDKTWKKLTKLLASSEIQLEEEARSQLASISKEEFTENTVTYILASEPSVKRTGRIKEIHRSAEVRGEEGNTVLIKVAIDEEELTDRLPGATVTAKVQCGRHSLGYVWFHEVLSFIQTRILFRYF